MTFPEILDLRMHTGTVPVPEMHRLYDTWFQISTSYFKVEYSADRCVKKVLQLEEDLW